MRWYKIKNLSGCQFRRVVGVKKMTFKMLVGLLRSKWAQRRKAGGPTPKLCLEDQLLLALNYWRNYGTYLETGTKFGISESAAWFICRWIEDNLKSEKALHLPGKKQLLAGKDKYEVVVFDVTECPIERPKRKKTGRRKNRQKRYYSGKKKRHTIKQQIAVDAKSETIIATSQNCGRTHDFKIYKKSKNHIHPETKVQTDSGYQGIQKVHANSELPKKRSKKNPLTNEDKKRNREISSQRVVVENIFAFLKKFKIISQRYRNRRKRFGLRFNLICAIFNYEWNE
jgi:IS5 family transposase